MGGCPVRMSHPEQPGKDGDVCGRDAHPGGKGRCYFHAEVPKDPEEFLARFLQHVENAEGRWVDCTRFVVPDGFALKDGYTFVKPPNFREATFGDGAQFNGASFGDDAGFEGASFGGNAWFMGVSFGDDAGFEGASFGGNAWFVGVSFGDDAGFDGASFGDGAGFDGASFGDGAWFEGASFGGNAWFNGASFGDGAWFDGASFGGDAWFEGASFGDGAWFGGASFGDGAWFGGASFGDGVGFEGASFGGNAGFNGASFGGNAGFEGASFGGDAGFDGASFGDGVGFEGASFGDDVLFHSARFLGHSHFQRMRCEGTSSFTDIHVLGPMNLSDCVLDGISSWAGARLYPSALVDWSDAEIGSDLRFDDLLFPDGAAALAIELEHWAKRVEHARRQGKPEPEPPDPDAERYTPRSPDVRMDFRSVPIRAGTRIRFQGTKTGDARNRMDCTKVLFAHTDVSQVRFRNVRWDQAPAWRTAVGARLRRDRTVVRVADEAYLARAPGRPASGADVDVPLDPLLVADIYKGLRATYEANLRYADAGRFHYREMEMRRIGKGEPALRRAEDAVDAASDETRPARAAGLRGWAWLNRRWASVRRQVNLLTVYRATSRYGESIGLPLLLLALWVPFFGWAMGHDLLPDPPGLLREVVAWFTAGLVVVPSNVAGSSIKGLVGRVGAVYFVAVVVIALRRQFRRGGGNL